MKQHSPGFLKLVTAAKQRIKEISPLALKEKMDSNESFQLIDVRETNEWETGHIPGAVHLGKGVIERDIEKQISDLKTPIVVYCSGGFRCALVADNLQAMGYEQVYSLESGSQGWIDAGFNLVK
ncbi:rhodanese domain protein [Legionella quinlivanii]|uniref:Rhodanese domain protein n=1 Tax=Legionella quinlivanii TaxID=45073 RepID=A0A0W0XUF8_9GAMM|nr:rhodanese-like domain-containing protein [Legionella quinlivanii]KTD48169.1 rhodanese domain protein [Legionella quinlivanii]SEG47292.1 Rhodanese-related sulfurtransferase [Legionella quinlivanii DSM 21216]STY10064.1 rhodanese domain protein [Legionella quinlivanii]